MRKDYYFIDCIRKATNNGHKWGRVRFGAAVSALDISAPDISAPGLFGARTFFLDSLF